MAMHARLAAAIMILQAWRSPSADRRRHAVTYFSKAHSGLSADNPLIIGACCALFVILLFGQNLYASWWIIDDHEIMWFIGRGEHLSFSQFVPSLLETEIGNFGNYPRFRPVYYSLRLLECVVWGKQAWLWHGLRLAVATFFMFALWTVVAGGIGRLPAGLLSIYAMTFGFWPDVIGGLGASEVYGAFGLGVFLLGLAGILRTPTRNRNWAFLLVGMVVATGSKENFLILPFAAVVLLFCAAARRHTGLATRLGGILALCWSAWITIAVIAGITRAGTDVYGQSVQLSDRARAVWSGGTQPWLLVLLLVAAAMLSGAWYYRERQASFGRSSILAALGIGSAICLWLSQVFFYNGLWPTGTRYDFPGLLSWPLAIFVILWYLRTAGLVFGVPVKAGWIAYGLAIAITGTAAGSHLNNIRLIRQAAAASVRRTSTFALTLEDIDREAAAHPNYAIVFQSDNPWDYEPFFSYPRFLHAAGVENASYLLWLGSKITVQGSFEETLTQRISAISASGLPGYYRPLADLTLVRNRCILVRISGAHPGLPCQIQVNGAWRTY
jgi:hypothetical protein